MFTQDKIRIIDHEDCKDANEVLLKHGKEKLKELFEKAKEVKVSGVYECLDFENEIFEDYRNGQPRGTTTYFANIDPHWTHRKGEVTIWTGYNNEGKSLFLKQLLLLKSKYEGWKHAVYSPEEMPFSEWYTDMIETYIGKSADKENQRYGNYMTEMQLIEGMKFMQKHFFSVFPEDEQTIDEILKKFSYLVRKKNIQTVTLDPYNQIQHMMQHGEREDLYISRFMSKLKKFAVEHDVAVHLIAHQVTPDFIKNENYPEPNIYKIKGGGTFADKADNVLIVWRENRNTDIKDTSVKFISRKIKKQKLTGIPGDAILKYDRRTNRYLYLEQSPFDTVVENEQTIITEAIDPNKNIEPNTNFENECPF
jgi:twinkle protein